MLIEIRTTCVEETVALGKRLGERVGPGTVVCLTGDLGTGKTHFAKGFAEGLGVRENITSPTFTLLNEYHEGRLPFYHFDVYRVNDLAEVLDLGFEEVVYGKNVVLIEWADLIEAILPDDLIHVRLEKEALPDERRITLRSLGKNYAFLKELD